MGETAGQDDHVRAFEIGVLVPDEFSGLAEHRRRRVIRVVVAVRTRKDDDREFHDSVNLDAITLDDRVGQELVGHFGRERLRMRRFGRGKVQFEQPLFSSVRTPS